MIRPSVLVYTVLYNTGVDYSDLPYAKHTVAINERYCKKHGYEFRVLGLPDGFPDRPPAWLRVWHAKQNIDKYDYIMFVDGDAFFVDHKQNLDHLFLKYFKDEDACFLFARDQKLQNHIFHAALPNAGVFIIRNSKTSGLLVDEWWDVPGDARHEGKLFYDSGRYLDSLDTIHHHPYEQLAVWFVMDNHHEAFRLTDDYRELNALDGQFVRHLIQVPDSVRERATQEFYLKLGEL